MADTRLIMDSKCIPNDQPLRALPCAPEQLLESTLSQLIREHPPLSKYDEEKQKGIFSGYTSLVYLLLRLSALHPHVQADGKDLRIWVDEYMKPLPAELSFKSGYGGLHSEKLSVEAIRACLSGADADVYLFLDHIQEYLGPYKDQDPYPAELFYGRAGVLYILRMVKFYVPGHATTIQSFIKKVADKVMQEGEEGGWKFANKRFLGPCHGDIGIITQLVLSLPELAPRLSDELAALLDLQLPNGNWPSSDTSAADDADLVQFCHGAPGFVICLKSLRRFFPNLEARIAEAISRAEKVVWERGLLKKEPSICHGILGNALALPLGTQRRHFLDLATHESVEKFKLQDPDVFQKACYTADISTYLNYLPSAAWAWAVCTMDEPPVIAFNDL